MQQIFIITGHTASGKSSFLEKIDISDLDLVINLDALQIFKDNKILSAQPVFKYNYKLYGYLESTERSDVFDFLSKISSEIKPSYRRIFLIGGSPLYVRKLLDGIATVPKITKEEVALVETEYEADKFCVYNELLKVNRDYESFIKLNDKKRICRYLSVFRFTGCKLEDFDLNRRHFITNEHIVKICLKLDRDLLYNRSAIRVENMFDAGAVSEVADFLERYRNMDYKNFSIYNTIGFSEIEVFLRGDCTLDDTKTLIKQKTRNYIKHQDTWYRNKFTDFEVADSFDSFCKLIKV